MQSWDGLYTMLEARNVFHNLVLYTQCTVTELGTFMYCRCLMSLVDLRCIAVVVSMSFDHIMSYTLV